LLPNIGLPANGGPYRVITQLGVYGFDDPSKRLQLVSLHAGVTPEQAQEASAFPILMPERAPTTEEPSGEELRLLREIDPLGMSIGRVEE